MWRKKNMRSFNHFLNVFLDLKVKGSQIKHIDLICSWSSCIACVGMAYCLCIQGKHNKFCLGWNILQATIDILLHICKARPILSIFDPLHVFSIECQMSDKLCSCQSMRLISIVTCAWKFVNLHTPRCKKLLVGVLLSNLVIFVVKDHACQTGKFYTST